MNALKSLRLGLKRWQMCPTLTDAGVQQLADSLQGKLTLQHLYLNLHSLGDRNQNVTGKSMEFVANAIKTCSNLQFLSLNFENWNRTPHGSLGNIFPEHIHSLAEMIQALKDLHTLHLTLNGLGALSKQINEACAIALFESIRTHANLVSLKLKLQHFAFGSDQVTGSVLYALADVFTQKNNFRFVLLDLQQFSAASEGIENHSQEVYATLSAIINALKNHQPYLLKTVVRYMVQKHIQAFLGDAISKIDKEMKQLELTVATRNAVLAQQQVLFRENEHKHRKEFLWDIMREAHALEE